MKACLLVKALHIGDNFVGLNLVRVLIVEIEFVVLLQE